MNPFRKIVVATDFSAASRRAVDLAAAVATDYGAELTIVHAVEPFIPPYPIALVPDPGTFKGAAEKELRAETARVAAMAPQVEAELLIGAAAPEVLKFAEQRKADLMVIGTHGRRGVSRWLLGSVAERIVRESHVPVLTVRGTEEDEADASAR
jgi:nucleotide-binding universal stress UspA family protein